jgi:hypothetical protein
MHQMLCTACVFLVKRLITKQLFSDCVVAWQTRIQSKDSWTARHHQTFNKMDQSQMITNKSQNKIGWQLTYFICLMNGWERLMIGCRETNLLNCCEQTRYQKHYPLLFQNVQTLNMTIATILHLATVECHLCCYIASRCDIFLIEITVVGYNG